jgi:hypothetical protein
MQDLLKRIYNIARSQYSTAISSTIPESNKKTHGSEQKKTSQSSHNFHDPGHNNPDPQVIDDLKIFNLHQDATFDDVKKARLQEIKKYHSDKFMDNPEKQVLSKKIMQIYNTAYERLKIYFKST